MFKNFSWSCPFCQHSCVVTDANFSTALHPFNKNNKYENIAVKTTAIICPNPECQEPTITAALYPTSFDAYERAYIPPNETNLFFWRLHPQSSSKQFPDYIPDPIRQDYLEACLIRDLSPKASATLSRRCLQGIIRDFWEVSRPRLIDEIREIESRVDPLTFKSIDAVRSIGNIGAHMEKDINLVIDVDPMEAGMLIELIETLIQDWYINRHEREIKLQALVSAAESKKQKGEKS